MLTILCVKKVAMDYTLKNQIPCTPHVWSSDPFYTKSTVLAVDVGMEGIGVALRKGKEILFAQTFLIGDTTRTLEERRLKRAWRRARASRKKRESLLKHWIIRHGLLTKERVDAIWHDPKVFQNALELRLRGAKQNLASPEALVACLRHGIQHRGFDYHLSGDSAYPWGPDWNYAKVIQWGNHGCCSEDTARLWKNALDETEFSDNEEKRRKLEEVFDAAARRYRDDPIEKLLRDHFREEKHPNLRSAFRGPNNHFPRELIKQHLRRICLNNSNHFANTRFETAVNELIGPEDKENHILDGKDGCIIDYHRRTREEAKELWERKTNPCPYAERLGLQTEKGGPMRCSTGIDSEIRRFKLLQFLAERTFVLGDGLKYPVTDAVYRLLLAKLEEDIAAIADNKPRPKVGTRDIQGWILGVLAGAGMNPHSEPSVSPKTKAGKVTWAKNNSHNKAFFDQLLNLLYPRRSELERRASLSKASAALLYAQALPAGAIFNAEEVKTAWKESYYLWRTESRHGGPVYPHTVFLFGHPEQYDPITGTTLDRPQAARGTYKGREHPGSRRDGKAQEHGVLRRLFAGQLKDPHGRRIDLSAHLDGKATPDFIIIETIGEIPKGPRQKAEIEKRQKANRERRIKLAEKYELGDRPKRSDQLRVDLFEQQIPEGGVEALCPVTGQSLGTKPLDPRLHVAHIYPDSRGGIYERLNLFLTTTQVNAAMGQHTPFECADHTRQGITFLGWAAMKELTTRRLRWGKAKRELFLREESTIPEWNNLTRMSQLARQLKVAAERWLGLDQITDPVERLRTTASRIGTPTGSMTAACRAAWRAQLPDFMRAEKNRANLRHHLYDAIVLSHIPPGPGQNFASCGGIFLTKQDKSGREVLSALPNLLPHLQPFEEAHAAMALVHKHRPKHSKQSRTEQTIYSSHFAQESEASVKLRVRKAILTQIQNQDTFVPAKGVETWLKDAGIPSSKLPRKIVENWIASEGAKTLRLKDGTPVHSVPVATTEEQWTSLVPHRNAQGGIIGYKTTTEAYDSCTIWVGPKRNNKGELVLDQTGQTIEDYHAVLVPAARNQEAFYKRTRKRWTCAEPPPPDFKILGKFRKGDLAKIALTRQAGLAETTVETHRWFWYCVTSIKTNGQLEFKLAEFKPAKPPKEEEVRSGKARSLTLEEKYLSAAETKKPGSAKTLAKILKDNPHLLASEGVSA